jgi:hypothetical protein
MEVLAGGMRLWSLDHTLPVHQSKPSPSRPTAHSSTHSHAVSRRPVGMLSLALRPCFQGKAFRGWLQLIDSKRRQEFLEWALGPDMSVVTNKLKAATVGLRADMEAQTDTLREEMGVHTHKLRQEAAMERKVVLEALSTKLEGPAIEAQQAELMATRREVQLLRDQLASMEAAATLVGEESSLARSQLAHQIATLARDVDERVAEVHQAAESRAGQDDKVMVQVTEDLRTMQRSKANHEELLAIVAKLQHRPKPGYPIGVAPLLTVPYPLPSGQARTASPRRPTNRPSSASLSRPRPHAEMREVPTCLPGVTADGSESWPQQPLVATSEQILVSSLPADAESMQEPHPPRGSRGHLGARDDGGMSGAKSGDAYQGSNGRLGGRVLVPPSSHTTHLSSRPLSATHASARRPASARPASSRGPVSNFTSRTERLERSLSGRTNDVEPTRPDLV